MCTAKQRQTGTDLVGDPESRGIPRVEEGIAVQPMKIRVIGASSVMQIHMSQRIRACASQGLKAVIWVGLIAGMRPALSAPVIQQVSGALNHKGTITISGTGFGSKATAAPLVWDDATGSDISDKWDGAWPNLVPGYNMNYYSPMRGISPPHSHDTRYIAGAHATTAGAYSGEMVMFYKHITLQAFPFYVYASWYQRADDAWIFGGDNNYKTFDYSAGGEPMEANNWYTAYGPPHPGNRTDGAQWLFTDDGGSLSNPDVKGHNAWWETAVNPMAGKWSKVEIAIKVTDQTNGYINVRENGHEVLGYVGPTDKYPGTQRSIGIGGFARMEGHTSNWRYFDDAYLDTTLSRVVLADKPALSRATIIENQIPSSWSDGSITATVNLGKFAQGQAAYLFVVDSSGTPSATGVTVTAGGTAATPNAPSAISVH
jgi:hypothetical protein